MKKAPDKLKAGELLREMGVAMYAVGSLDAKNLCTLMYYASMAGACGVDDLGFRPDAPTGHYSRHLKLVLGICDEDHDLYELDVPLFSKWGSNDVPYGICCV